MAVFKFGTMFAVCYICSINGYSIEEYVPREHGILKSSTTRILVWPRRSQNGFGIEHIEVQSGVPRSIMKINARIPMIFMTSENPEPAPWLVQPRRSRIIFDFSVLSPLEGSKSLRYL